MRKVLIKEVQELTNDEVEMLLENDSVQDDIMDYVMESELSYIDDMLIYIKPYLSDYSITAYSYSYMNVNDATGFINGVEKLNDDFGIFNDTDVKTLHNAIETADRYIFSEIGGEEYIDARDELNSYIKVISNYLINEFVEILEYYGSFDRVYYESDYINVYLENMYNRECLVDGDKVTLI